MGAAKDEEVEIDLRSGIFPNESFYAIGPRLYAAQNAVWGWRYPQLDDSLTSAGSPPHLLRMPTYFPSRSAITYQNDPAMFLDIGFCFNTTSAQNRTKLIIGTRDTGVLRLWEAETGNILALASGVTGSNISTIADPFPATSVYWPTPGAGTNITRGTLFFSHTEASRVYYLVDDQSTIRSLTDDGIANAPTGARALAVHINRLWMAETNTSVNAFTYKLTFTDPFDAETIQPQNFINIPDVVNCMLSSTPGDIDQTGTPHLFVGCENSIWMIDGDPTTTQALKRQIGESIGVPSPYGLCITPYGPAFIASDNQIYLCTPDGRQITPIGSPILNTLNNPEFGGTTRAGLVWFSPYLYYFPSGDPTLCYVCDLTNPTKPVWWGALVNPDLSVSEIAITKAAPGGYSIHAAAGLSSNLAGPVIYSAGKISTSTGHFLGFDRYTEARGNYPHGHQAARQQALSTGYIFKQGQQVEAKRVVLYTTTKPTTYTWNVSVRNEKEQVSVGVLDSVTPISTTTGSIQRHLYTFPNHANAVGQALRLVISGPSTSQSPYTQDMQLERVRMVVRFADANV